MAFEFHLSIPEDSARGQAILHLAEDERITPEQALDRIIEAGIGQKPFNAILAGRGLFSSPEDASVLTAAVELAYAERKEPSRQ